MVGEHRGIAPGLGGDELAQGEVASRHGQVLPGRRGDLHVDAGGRPALVVLPGGVEEARPPPEGRRAARAVEQVAGDVLEVSAELVRAGARSRVMEFVVHVVARGAATEQQPGRAEVLDPPLLATTATGTVVVP